MIKGLQCVECKHLCKTERKGDVRCAAFPDGIPDAILDDRHDHTYPYPGDKGIHYEAADAAAIERRKWFNDKYGEDPNIAWEAIHLSPHVLVTHVPGEVPSTVARDAEWAAKQLDPPGIPADEVMAKFLAAHNESG